MALDLGFTIQGRGGQALYWVDNTGQTPSSALSNYNFVLLPNAQDDWQSATSGSLLLSAKFTVASTQKLTVVARLITAHARPYNDVGFALLLKNSQVHKVLFALRPDGANRRGDIGPNDINRFAAPSPGVTETHALKGVANVTLDGITYGPPAGPDDGNCSTEVTAECIPGAGDYQVLFGMFVVSDVPNLAKPAALIAQFVDIR